MSISIYSFLRSYAKFNDSLTVSVLYTVVIPHPFPWIFVGEEEGSGGRKSSDQGRSQSVVESAESFLTIDVEAESEHRLRRSGNLANKIWITNSTWRIAKIWLNYWMSNHFWKNTKHLNQRVTRRKKKCEWKKSWKLT